MIDYWFVSFTYFCSRVESTYYNIKLRNQLKKRRLLESRIAATISRARMMVQRVVSMSWKSRNRWGLRASRASRIADEKSMQMQNRVMRVRVIVSLLD